jgi:hypothetical protein
VVHTNMELYTDVQLPTKLTASHRKRCVEDDAQTYFINQSNH